MPVWFFSHGLLRILHEPSYLTRQAKGTASRKIPQKMEARLLVSINVFECSHHFMTSKGLEESLTHCLFICPCGPKDQ